MAPSHKCLTPVSPLCVWHVVQAVLLLYPLQAAVIKVLATPFFWAYVRQPRHLLHIT